MLGLLHFIESLVFVLGVGCIIADCALSSSCILASSASLQACLNVIMYLEIFPRFARLHCVFLFNLTHEVITVFYIMQIHWFSIFNSFMMVIFLTGLVSMILMRTLRNDYAKYAREDDDLESLVMLL